MTAKKTFTIIAWTFILFPAFCACGCKEEANSNVSNNNTLTKKQIMEIANKEAASRGFKLNFWTKVLYDINNEQWKECYVFFKEQLESNETDPYTILEKTDYQAVHYYPRIVSPGGGLWVFVDRKTGEIITVLIEE